MTSSSPPSQVSDEQKSDPKTDPAIEAGVHPGIEPTRADIDSMPGLVLLEFGANWCGYCKAAQGQIAKALAQHGPLMHIKIEDGKGKRLGRSFSVKLWPTLIAVLNGVEVGRVVRPQEAREILDILPST